MWFSPVCNWPNPREGSEGARVQKFSPVRCMQWDLSARLTKVNIVEFVYHFHCIGPIEQWSLNQCLELRMKDGIITCRCSPWEPYSIGDIWLL